MQPIPQHLKDLARRVAQHEFGHYVAATILGFTCGDVSLTVQPNGHLGQATVTLPSSTRSLIEVDSYLERRIQILYAGAAAETLRSSAPEKLVDRDEAVRILSETGRGAEQDHAKVRELVHVLRNIRHADTISSDLETIQAQLTAINDALWEKAVALVEFHADAICSLAGTLTQKFCETGNPATLEKAFLESLPGVRVLMSKNLVEPV